MPRLSGSAKRKVCSRPGQHLQAKLGPKPDLQAARRIARAARQRARGIKWPELYERFPARLKELNPVTRADAEDGFRLKVNKQRQRHQRLRKRA